jgi:hypothetical protein
MSTATASELRRELAHRTSGGLEVTLYWNASDDRTSVEVRQRTSDEALALAFAVPHEHALDAFYHPFAHLPLTLADLVPTQKLERDL